MISGPSHAHFDSPRLATPASVKFRIQELKVRLITALCLLLVSASPAAVVYSGLQDTPIPNNLDGLYLNMATNTTSGSYPADWGTKPYFNPFQGGVAIATSELFLPIIMGSDQVVNMAYASLIDFSGNFALGENASGTHVGVGGGQFTLGNEGYMGFRFQTSTGGPFYYGWARIVISNSGNGQLRDWAYNDVAGIGLFTGMLTPAPEPGRALMVMLGTMVMGLRRRRFQ